MMMLVAAMMMMTPPAQLCRLVFIFPPNICKAGKVQYEKYQNILSFFQTKTSNIIDKKYPPFPDKNSLNSRQKCHIQSDYALILILFRLLQSWYPYPKPNISRLKYQVANISNKKCKSSSYTFQCPHPPNKSRTTSKKTTFLTPNKS